MAARSDPIIAGRSRDLSSVATFTLSATVAYSDQRPPGQGIGPVFISESRYGSSGPIQTYSITTVGTVRTLHYGFTYSGTYHEQGSFVLDDAGYPYSPSNPPPTVPPGVTVTTIHWGVFTWSVSGTITTSGTYGDVWRVGAASASEVLLPGVTGSRVITIEGVTFSSTLAPSVADWDARLVNEGGVSALAGGYYGPGYGISGYNAPLDGAGYVHQEIQSIGGIDTLVFVYTGGVFDVSAARTWTASISLGGLTVPAAPAGYSCPLGRAGGGSVTIAAAPTNRSYSGGLTFSASPLHTFDVTCRLWDLTGHANTTPKDVEIYFRQGDVRYGEQSKPFLLHGVTGSASRSFIVGGAQQTVRFTDGITVYADAKDSYMKAPDGLTSIIAGAHTLDGTPLPCLADDPITRQQAGTSYSSASPTSVVGKSAFEIRLPVKAGGINLKQSNSLSLFGTGSAWPWAFTNSLVSQPPNTWFPTASGITLSTTAAGNNLRLNVTGGSIFGFPGAYYTPLVNSANPTPMIPYRFVRIKYRSVGAANLPISFTFLSSAAGGRLLTKDCVTGGAGVWVETLIDLQRDGIRAVHHSGGDDSQTGALLYALCGQVQIAGMRVGIYEIESIIGERHFESLAGVLMPHPAAMFGDAGTGLNERAGNGVRPLHGVTDGMVTLSQQLGLFPTSSTEIMAGKINGGRWPAWTATLLQPKRGDKPAPSLSHVYALQPGDATDSEADARWLAGGGLYRDGTTTLDKTVNTSSGIDLPIQPAVPFILGYPGMGQSFDGTGTTTLAPGAYGGSTTLVYDAIVKAQVVGVLTGGTGDKILVNVIPGGADAGQGTATSDDGYTPTLTPNAPQGTKVLITTQPAGRIVEWDPASGRDTHLTIESGGPYDHFKGDLNWANQAPSVLGRQRLWCFFTVPPATQPARSPRNLNTRQGGWYAAPVVRGTARRGRVQFRRTRGEQVPEYSEEQTNADAFALTVYASTPGESESDEEPWPWYELRDSSVHLFYSRYTYDSGDPGADPATAVREAISHDDGETWTDSETATNARHPFALVLPGSTGGTLRAWFVPDSGGEEDDPITGTIVGTWQAEGDSVPSDPFTFQEWNGSDLVDMVVQDDNFSLTDDLQSQARVNLIVLMAGEDLPANYQSSDISSDGATWTRVPGTGGMEP